VNERQKIMKKQNGKVKIGSGCVGRIFVGGERGRGGVSEAGQRGNAKISQRKAWKE